MQRPLFSVLVALTATKTQPGIAWLNHCREDVLLFAMAAGGLAAARPRPPTFVGIEKNWHGFSPPSRRKSRQDCRRNPVKERFRAEAFLGSEHLAQLQGFARRKANIYIYHT